MRLRNDCRRAKTAVSSPAFAKASGTPAGQGAFEPCFLPRRQTAFSQAKIFAVSLRYTTQKPPMLSRRAHPLPGLM